MKETRLIMGMPITVEIKDLSVSAGDLEAVFIYFAEVDARFSTYKDNSEVSRFNRGEIENEDLSSEMKEVLALSEETKNLTDGYFDIVKPGSENEIDPSGLVKGWAIFNAAKILRERSLNHFYIEAGGDIQAATPQGEEDWRVGIRHPFEKEKIIKVLKILSEGVATSGTYLRGQHIYNPHEPNQKQEEVVSLTVVGENVYEADRFATAGFAMGLKGIEFIGKIPGLEGYQVDAKGNALMTSGFPKICYK